MFGPFAIPGFGMSTKMRKEQQERQEQEMSRRLEQAVPWTPKLPWAPKLTIEASTWPTWRLFDVEPTKHANVNHEAYPDGKFVYSPNGQFLFCLKTLPPQAKILTLQGSRRGDVMFNGPVNIPCLHERVQSGGAWREDPWMSITPMEVMTQRPGTKLAKGHVVVAGLGLGWGLVEAFKKKSVTKVTLVERSQELVDWIMPALAPRLRGMGKDFDTIVGDARDVLGDFKADVALIDIFKGYGGNTFHTTRRPEDRFSGGPPRNIPVVWCWGTAPLADEPRGWF